MLSRPLVYTALTRAQRHLSIVHAGGAGAGPGGAGGRRPAAAHPAGERCSRSPPATEQLRSRTRADTPPVAAATAQSAAVGAPVLFRSTARRQFRRRRKGRAALTVPATRC